MQSSANAKKGRVRWDEENLSENEKLKKEMNTTAIEEPKTPYHSPCASQTDLKGLEQTCEDYQATLDEEMTNAGLLESETAEAKRPKPERKVSFDKTAEGHDDIDHADNTEFEALRKQHYAMRDAFKKGKELMNNDNGQELQYMANIDAVTPTFLKSYRRARLDGSVVKLQAEV